MLLNKISQDLIEGSADKEKVEEEKKREDIASCGKQKVIQIIENEGLT